MKYSLYAAAYNPTALRPLHGCSAVAIYPNPTQTRRNPMAVNYTLASKTRVDVYKDRASEGDAKTYQFDLTPWQADNSTITGVTWNVESGSAGISNQQLVAGVASALINFPTWSRVLISLQIVTANEAKKIWLEVAAKKVIIDGLNDYDLHQS